MMDNDDPDAHIMRVFRMEDARHKAYVAQRIDEIMGAWQEMRDRAAAVVEQGEHDESILRWCRERIEIPEETPVPSGRVHVDQVIEHIRSCDRRKLAILDATMRAELEQQLMTVPADLH